MGVCNCSMFCCTLLYVHSIFVIILMGKRELVDCLVCLPGVSWWLCGSSPSVCLQFVVVVFPDHTHLLFLLLTRKVMFGQTLCRLANCLDSSLNVYF